MPKSRPECRCGECCRRLIIEVAVEDAEREPKIKKLGSPTYLPGILTCSGKAELIGYRKFVVRAIRAQITGNS
jgi:hypothetical protein